jgi:3-hydroxyisobutyrate dehydrogenase-like beta-hydroxyacid dehydrogenase
MSAIEPRRMTSPILLGGPYAAAFAEVAAGLGFSDARVLSDEIGRASAVKMCRSVMIKGMEALLAESLIAARHYGVEAEVLGSLNNLLPLDDWEGKARYMISRSLRHGLRRAEEMREAAATVAAAGLDPHMSRAIVARQEWAAQYLAAAEAELPEMLDTLAYAAEDRMGRGAIDG